jgi:hypothetical protein
LVTFPDVKEYEPDCGRTVESFAASCDRPLKAAMDVEIPQ